MRSIWHSACLSHGPTSHKHRLNRLWYAPVYFLLAQEFALDHMVKALEHTQIKSLTAVPCPRNSFLEMSRAERLVAMLKSFNSEKLQIGLPKVESRLGNATTPNILALRL